MPGPKSWSSLPLVGHAYLLGPDPTGTLLDLQRRHGPVFRLDLGPAPTVIIGDYDVGLEAYRKEAFDHRPDLPGMAAVHGVDPEGVTGGVGFSNGRAHREGRRVLIRSLAELGMTTRAGVMEDIIIQVSAHPRSSSSILETFVCAYPPTGGANIL